MTVADNVAALTIILILKMLKPIQNFFFIQRTGDFLLIYMSIVMIDNFESQFEKHTNSEI